MKKQLFNMLILLSFVALNAGNFKEDLSECIVGCNYERFEQILSKHKSELESKDKIKYLNLIKERTSYLRDILSSCRVRPSVIPTPKTTRCLRISFVSIIVGSILLSIKEKTAFFTGLGSLGLGVASYLVALRFAYTEADYFIDLITLGYKNTLKMQELMYDIL